MIFVEYWVLSLFIWKANFFKSKYIVSGVLIIPEKKTHLSPCNEQISH